PTRCSPLPPSRCSSLLPHTTLFRSIAVYTSHALLQPQHARGEKARAVVRRGPHHRPQGGVVVVQPGQDGSQQDAGMDARGGQPLDRKSTRLNSSHVKISYAVFCLKK